MGQFDELFDSAAKQYGVDPSLLKGVAQTESGMNPGAISDQGAQGLMQLMPDTAKALGVKNAFDPTQAIPAAAKLLRQNLDASGDDVKSALMMYHGGTDVSQWGAKTRAYPGVVLNNQAKAVKGDIAGNDPVYRFLTGQPAAQGTSAGSGGASTDPVLAYLQSGGKNVPQASQPQQPQPAQNVTQDEPGSWTQLGHGLASVADTALSAPGAIIKQIEYAGRRAVGQSPDQATQGANNGVGAFFENPVGKAFGVTNTSGYQNEDSRQIMNFIGQNISKGADWISQQTNLPKADVENMIQTLSMAAPKVLHDVAPTISQALQETIAGDMERPTSVVNPRDTYTASTPMEPRPVVGMGAATANTNPYPVLTGEESARGPFPQVKTTNIGHDVTPAEQSVRAQIANKILGEDNGGVRSGVVTGNINTLRNEYTAAAAPNPTPAEALLKQQIASEQTALSRFAQDRIDATGASPTLTMPEQRGELINNVFRGTDNSLESYFKQAKQQIYDQAKQQQGDRPIEASNVMNLLTDPQFQAGQEFAGNAARLNGARQLVQLASSTGLKDPITGETLQPGSVGAWDAVRKSLNASWTPENASLIRQINGAIDQDIAAAGGPQLYKLGSDIHRAEMQLMESKGIGTIFGKTDANGVQLSGKPLEQIPQALNNLPMAQWRHIYDTLDSLSRGQIRGAPEGMPAVPDGLAQAAAQAKAEMTGNLARQVYEAGANKVGVWNQNSVNNVLNGPVGQKILEAMPPDEIANFHTLNIGGQIMPGIHSYEGAGLQAQRLAGRGFIEKNAPGAMAAIGSKAGPIGAVIGEKTGNIISNRFKSYREGSQMTRLSRIMKANSDMGKK